MNCQDWKPVLIDFARGLVTDQTQKALLHAQECAHCSAELKEQSDLTQKLKPAILDARQQPAQNISPALLKAFRDSRRVERRNQHILIWARAAVLLIAIFGSWMWFRSQPETQSHVTSTHRDLESAEYDEEFIPLQFGGHSVNSWQVIRVELESSSLQQLGLPRVPEWEDRPVQADIVVGEDGLPQAIRFVSLDQ